MTDSQMDAIWKILGNSQPLTDRQREFTRAVITAVTVTPVAQQGECKPEAWMVPQLLTFKDAARTSCPAELQPALEGTVMWSPSLAGDMPPVVDRDGVVHTPYPLGRTHVAAPAERQPDHRHKWLHVEVDDKVYTCISCGETRTCIDVLKAHCRR